MGVVTKRVRLVVSKGEHETEGLFDSGASCSFIRRDVVERLATLETLPQPMTFEMAEQGATVIARERVVLDFWIDSFRFSDEFLVLEDLANETHHRGKAVQKWQLKLGMEQEDIIIDPSATRSRFV